VTEAGSPEYWLDDFVFEDDPRVDAAYRAERKNRGGSGIIRLARDANGTWRGSRTIILPRGDRR